MPLKKRAFGEDELLIFDDAIIYQRDGHWQLRMWLPPERKYVRKTLNTRHRTTATVAARVRNFMCNIVLGALEGQQFQGAI